ncbi:MAG: K(+)/H(+) antiporter NhaP [Phycisphaerae bacterium]|nr:K(+)/H(+) antiporter NhaP [Phycisphaerae bacterium]
MLAALQVQHILLGTAILLLTSVLASRASERLGVPALLMFLLIGMLAGSEGFGGIYFDDAGTAQLMGTFALAFILFAGGLDTNWQSVRPLLAAGMLLATAGVLLTAVFVAVFAIAVLGFSWPEGLLLGSIISSTDAAAVFAILRSRSVSLKGRLRPLLELESGSNDPMAVFLTVTMVAIIKGPTGSWFAAFPSFLIQMALGGAMGLLFGKGLTFLVNRAKLEYEGLYPVLTLATVLLTFGATETLGGNGFLAVYLAGIICGNADFLHKRSLSRFHDGLAWLMQIAMFLTLGLLVFPSRLVPVIGPGLLLSSFLMLLARPLSVMLCLAGARMTFAERVLTSWVGLRGAVPIVLATFPLVAGVPRADTIFHLVFFVVITSVLLQGKSLPIVARWLKLDMPLSRRARPPLELDQTDGALKAALTDVLVSHGSAAAGKRLIDLGLPRGVLVALVHRNGDYFIPTGSTVLLEDDSIMVLAEPEALTEVQRLAAGPADPGTDQLNAPTISP